MIRLPRLASLAALPLSLLVACDDPDRKTATFSTADDAHLRRAVEVIRAGDAGQLFIPALFLAGEHDPTACPSITTVGNVTTITGGCTDDDGDRFEGRIVATNFQGAFTELPSYDPTQPTVAVAEGFTATTDTQTVSLDGRVSSAPRGATPEEGMRLEALIDATIDGLHAHTDATYDCDATDLCTLAGGSWVDIDGVGAAELSGTYRYDEPRTGAITATGAETLVIDVVASTDCIAFTIDGGAVRQLCDEEEPSSRRVPALRFAPGATTLLDALR